MFYDLVEAFEKAKNKQFWFLDKKTENHNEYIDGILQAIIIKQEYVVKTEFLTIYNVDKILERPYYSSAEEAEKVARMCNQHLKFSGDAYKRIPV